MPAARAAIATGRAAAARRHAARLLWQGETSGDELRELRLLVIESYVADRRGDDAYRSMLRFDLDHRPVERRAATRFVVALLELGMAKEAVNWLASLDDGEPIKLMLRLQAGLVEPEAAITLARPAAIKRPAAGWWGVIARAARMQGSRPLQIEALEQLSQHSPPGDSSQAASARDLWQAYFAAARESADRHHLLDNDDAGWGAFAASRVNTDPMMARAVFAHLARRGATPKARTNAQLQLELSLQLVKLDVAALRLFNDADVDVATLDPRLRYSLGGVGETHGLHAAAVRMWQGLELPPGLAPIAWQLRLAAAMVRAGMMDAGVTQITQAVAATNPWPPDVVKRASALSLEFLNAGHPGAAEPLLAALAQRADGLERRQILFNLGRASDAAGKPLTAAEHYLRSATLAESKSPDALARQARLAAGSSLARGGYRDDARAQFEWVLRNSRDPAQLDVARRELKKL
jgi:tetratricopeptide (TPR) repeat protein